MRDLDLLTEHSADLVPVEMPWSGTLDDAAMMMRTPYLQLIPFSHFSPSLENANMILAATSGTGKGMLVGKMLITYARQGAKVSILECGDSYAAAVEYMGGQMITTSLDSPYVINPFDLDEGETAPSNDHLSFVKNLVRYMIGESSQSDADILDSVILFAIKSAYSRASNRINKIPTLSDVRDELIHFNDKDNQRVNQEATLAATKLRPWVEDEMYASLFDRHTTVTMNCQWLYFNVEKLKDDPKLETAMSLLIAYATTKRANGTGRQKSITVLDECWSLLESKSLGPVVVQIFRTARKRNACEFPAAKSEMPSMRSSFTSRSCHSNDPNKRYARWGVAAYDRTNRLVVAYRWQVPALKDCGNIELRCDLSVFGCAASHPVCTEVSVLRRCEYGLANSSSIGLGKPRS